VTSALVDVYLNSVILAAESDSVAISRAKSSFTPGTPGTPLPDHWFHILLALADDDRHGLGIIQEVAAQTDGRVQVWPGMLYLALKRMTDEGLVARTEAPEGFVAGGGRPRFYRITPVGRRACRAEADRHLRLVNAARAKRVLGKDA
jgi:DNA-binding PadR family transcriptional regulator